MAAAADVIVSLDQYKDMMDDFSSEFTFAGPVFANWTETYQWKDGIPKEKFYVKLAPGINKDERAFISNGIRAFFTSPLMNLIERADVEESVQKINKVFNVLIYIIGGISLTIAFFLLLIATTQNVKEAIWEYGVLRAMGITMDEGQRIQMYEAYIVITSAAILGTLVGFCTSVTIAKQFYMFIELPVEVDFPFLLLFGLLIISLITTYFAVWIPMKQVNQQKIAAVLKAG